MLSSSNFKIKKKRYAQLALLMVAFMFLSTHVFAQPTVSAPTPSSRNDTDVISIFSDTYTQVPGTDFNPFWNQRTVVTTEDIDGNSTLKYSNFNYQGIQLSGSQNVSGMDFVHVDIWTNNASAMNLYLISPGPTETPYALPIVPNIWKSYEIPLSEFSHIVDLNDVFQFKLTDGGTGDSPTFYIDNLYFYKGEIGLSNNAALKEIRINGAKIPDFSPSIFEYEVQLSADSPSAPMITASPTNENATVVITPATELPGTTTVTVTAQNQSVSFVYSVNFTLISNESNAFLSDLQVEGISIENFNESVFHYTYAVNNQITAVPTITAVASNESAKVVIIPASTLPGTTVLKVTSTDETQTKIYSVFFKTEDLIWWDEFTAQELNQDFWSYNVGDGCGEGECRWGNFELQVYAKENVYIDEISEEEGNHALVIEARKNESGTTPFTSGRIHSENKVDLKYGILEIRMKVPDLSTGLWPAVWLLGSNHPEVGWPQSGEIDIMEMGQRASFRTQQGHPGINENQYVGSNIIWYSLAACNAGNPTCAAAIAGDVNYNQPYAATTKMNERFQIYRLYWNETAIRFTVEDENIERDLYVASFELGNTELRSIFREPFYVIINMAVGGNFTDAANAGQVSAPFPAKMYVDYVRLKDYSGSGEVFFDGVITSSEIDGSEELPEGFKLLQNYPNPFNPSTNITFQLQSPTNVKVSVFDVLGREVSVLVNEQRNAGTHTVNFNASGLSSGIYFYTLKVDGSIMDAKKMVLIK